MEPLGPRDTNVHYRMNHAIKQNSKQNPKPQIASTNPNPNPNPNPNGKEKDHPPPPPEEVYEPASFDQIHGVIYRAGRLLGKGGFAICYEGQDTTTQQKYALKIVKSQTKHKKMEQKVQTELQIHSKMNHANIVEFHRAFSYENCIYIVLELCQNGSLLDMVKKRRFLTEPEVRFWTVQMAGAIKYMHAKGIIHRDLKMGNIFLDKNMNVKIGDFGLAALLMSGKDMQACRRTTLCGTPNYIAPEILSKDKCGHDQAVDIWSLGIIIFAMLTGKPPFQSTTADEIYRRARERDYDWPTLNTSENKISKETKDLVTELLQAPDQRPYPDNIVQHSFFKCGWTPQSEEMTVTLRERPPDQNHLSFRSLEEKSIASMKNLELLCKQCEVGPWSKRRKYTSAYREVEEEQKLGLTPSIPLAEDVVYRPFHKWLEGQVIMMEKEGKSAVKALQLLRDIVSPAVKKHTVNQVSSTRPSTTSIAYQQRARPHVPRLPTYIEQPNKPCTVSSIKRPKIPSSRGREAITDVEDRLAIDMINQLNFKDEIKGVRELKAPKISSDTYFSIFNVTESIKQIPNTEPEFVLNRFRKFQAELEGALQSRSVHAEPHTSSRNLVVVVKWVDYTNRFGLGYILSNGSIGSIFKSIAAYPQEPKRGLTYPTCILVRHCDRHMINLTDPKHIDYGQVVPTTGENVEFFENRGDQGFFKSEIHPENFKILPSSNGEMFKLGDGRDDFETRRRERVSIWRKFGNYMTQYGRDASDEFFSHHTEIHSSSENFVLFYQRWGDVGCWGFNDGHIQFNFPDHTKIILSADGKFCEFYHLSLKAAHELSENGILSPDALDGRQKLSYPLETMLVSTLRLSRSRSHMILENNQLNPAILQANDFRKKIEFIVLCVKEWTTNGGVGISNLSEEGRLRWSGSRQRIGIKIPYKQVWVCIGGRATDERKVMLFDPRAPEQIVPDINH